MKRDIARDGNKIAIRPQAHDHGQKVRGLAKKKARLSDDERDSLLLAIAQKLGIPV